jgi:hypothetical protein
MRQNVMKTRSKKEEKKKKKSRRRTNQTPFSFVSNSHRTEGPQTHTRTHEKPSDEEKVVMVGGGRAGGRKKTSAR